MANYFDERRIYGFRYFQEKLLEKPFFLGVNGISGEPTEGKPWSLSFNPIFCDVYDNASPEDLVIFLLYICHYNNDDEESHIDREMFDQVLIVFSKILDRISSEFDPGTPIELDNIMAMFNSLNIMSDMLFRISKILTKVKYSQQCDSILNKILDMKNMMRENEHHKYYPTKPKILELISAGLSNMYFHLKVIHHIIVHVKNDPSASLNTIVESFGYNFVIQDDLSIAGVTDFFFNDKFRNIEIAEEFIDVNTVVNAISFNSVKIEEILSKANWEKKRLHVVNGSPILSKENLNHLEYLEVLCENPKKATVEYCRKIFARFYKSFNESFTPILKDNILMSPEEVQFIFQFMTHFLMSLKIMKKGIQLKKLVRVVFIKFGNILNLFRFQEIDRAICIETSAILSKALMDLFSDPLIKTYLPKMWGEMMAVLIRINVFLSKDKDMACLRSIEETDTVSLTVRDVKPIREISNISKARKSRWRKLLGDEPTAEGFLQDYNEGECPICLEKMQDDDYSLLLCKHNICRSCLEKFLGQPDTRKFCPVCRTPVCEYLPSRRIKRRRTMS